MRHSSSHFDPPVFLSGDDCGPNQVLVWRYFSNTGIPSLFLSSEHPLEGPVFHYTPIIYVFVCHQYDLVDSYHVRWTITCSVGVEILPAWTRDHSFDSSLSFQEHCLTFHVRWCSGLLCCTFPESTAAPADLMPFGTRNGALLFFFKDLFEIFHRLFHSPNGYSGQC